MMHPAQSCFSSQNFINFNKFNCVVFVLTHHLFADSDCALIEKVLLNFPLSLVQT